MDGSHCRAVEAERWLVQLSLVGCIAMVLTLLVATRASAMSIDPLTWEELVIGSDFFGVVECKTAGGIVAKYEVIEAWKEARAGELVSIRVALAPSGPQFPIALCGERYLIAGYKVAPSDLGEMLSFPFPYANPLWRRQVPADFQTPLFQGRGRLTSDRDNDLGFLFGRAAPYGSLDEIRKDAFKLLALSPEEQEERVLRTLFNKFDYRTAGKDDSASFARVRSMVEASVGAAQLVDVLVSALLGGDQGTRKTIQRVVHQGGGLRTLKALEKALAEGRHLDAEMRAYVIPSIRRRLGIFVPNTRPAQAGESLRFAYSEDAVVERLTRAEYILEESEADVGYYEASGFALHCTENREEQFKKLLSAKDPFIRVTGAVYLCFENRRLGMEKLRELVELEGDPGVWAALNLVRRGDKSAMERALEVFATKEDRGRSGRMHEHLQERVLVLLSNTAKHSGLPQPRRATPEPGSRRVGSWELHDYYVEWWKTHEAGAVPFDPWLELLEKQKVD